MTTVHNATIFVGGKPIGVALQAEFSIQECRGVERGHIDPPDAGRYELEIRVLDAGLFRALRDGVEKTAATTIVYRATSAQPIRQPYRVKSWASRSGRRLYGSATLGERFWTASSSKLEKRRVRTRIDAFNRIHPSPMGPSITDTFDGAMTGLDVRLETEKRPWADATLTLQARPKVKAIHDLFIYSAEGVSNR